MKKFSQLINEDRGNHDSVKLLRDDITKYITKLKRSLPVDVQKAIYLTSKYDITSKEELDKIRTANKSKLKDLVDELNIPLNELEDLWGLLKSMKQNYKVMPQYLSKSEREMIEKGQMALDDATIDLDTPAGKNAVAKLYTPLVMAISRQMAEKSSLRQSDLYSAGMLGLANAMNDWKREPDSKTGKVVPFKTYAGFRIRQQILNDMDAYSHSLSGTNSYATKKMRDGKIDSLDALRLDDFDVDRLGETGVKDKDFNEDPKWKVLYNALERQFTQRDLDIFYRYWGINGRQKEKSKDIAKSYGMSEGNIKNSVINKMIAWIKKKPTLLDILEDIFMMYTESLLQGMFGMDKMQMLEVFAGDDLYLLLEDATRWSNQSSFAKSYNYAISALNKSEQDVIKNALNGGFKTIDSTLRHDSNTYKKFLRLMNPTSSKKWTDGDLIEDMVEMSDYVHKYKL